MQLFYGFLIIHFGGSRAGFVVTRNIGYRLLYFLELFSFVIDIIFIEVTFVLVFIRFSIVQRE